MFTLEQLKAAHAQVKSGADFPAYIRDIIQLGVTNYETYVNDGHSRYYGKNGYEVTSGNKYDALTISEHVNAEQFRQDLKRHQQGQSDYLQFIRECASNGVEKWAVNMDAMTCTYYDKSGSEVLVEGIPR